MRRVFAGDRRVWLAGAAVLLAALALMLFYLLRSEPHWTGTNSTGVRSLVAEVPDGARLCVPELDVPAGTGRVQVAMAWPEQGRPALNATLQTESGTRRASLPEADLAAAAWPVGVDLDFQDLQVEGDSEEARLCLTPEGGSISLGGTAGLLIGRPPGTLDGEPLTGRITIRYLPPDRRGGQPSVAARRRGAARRPVPAVRGGHLAVRGDLPRPHPRALARLAAPARHACRGHGLRAGRRPGDRRGGDPQRGGVGADHAALAGTRRARPLRLYADARRARQHPGQAAVRQPRLLLAPRDRARRDAAPTRLSAWSTRGRRGWRPTRSASSGRWRRRRGRRTTEAGTCSRPRRTCRATTG